LQKPTLFEYASLVRTPSKTTTTSAAHYHAGIAARRSIEVMV
jgi:hypothetical protein